MGNKTKINSAFTLRLETECHNRLRRLAEVYGRSKTWVIEAMLLGQDMSDERLGKIRAQAKSID